jgi:thiamine-monophosphate kinase
MPGETSGRHSPLPPTPGEFDLIAEFRRRAGQASGVIRGIGDDCAILAGTGESPMLVTTDMLMEGRHFRLAEHGPTAVGRKAMGVNLSDIAAMAGRPTAAVVAVALPRSEAATIAAPLFEGLRRKAAEFGAPLVGGDTNAWDGPLVVSVTVIGRCEPAGPALRSEAQPGDVILVTGPLGGSLSGRHLEPRPRIVEALALRAAVDRLAMIDLSDGLASDLRHILDESGGLGAVLDAGAIPIHRDAAEMAGRDGRPAVEHALADGEDFELCLAVSPEDAARLLADPPGGVTLARVGVVTSDPGLRLRLDDGSVVPCPFRGFDHLSVGR